MSYYYFSMFCFVYSISRHGLSQDITDFVFEWETTKNNGQPTQYLGFGKDNKNENNINILTKKLNLITNTN